MIGAKPWPSSTMPDALAHRIRQRSGRGGPSNSWALVAKALAMLRTSGAWIIHGSGSSSSGVNDGFERDLVVDVGDQERRRVCWPMPSAISIPARSCCRKTSFCSKKQSTMLFAEATEDSSAQSLRSSTSASASVFRSCQGFRRKTLRRPRRSNRKPGSAQLVRPVVAGIGADDDIEAARGGCGRKHLLKQHARQVRIHHEADRRRRNARHAVAAATLVTRRGNERDGRRARWRGRSRKTAIPPSARAGDAESARQRQRRGDESQSGTSRTIFERRFLVFLRDHRDLGRLELPSEQSRRRSLSESPITSSDGLVLAPCTPPALGKRSRNSVRSVRQRRVAPNVPAVCTA